MRGRTILVVGSGAREHALAWKLAQSPGVARLLVAPGNAGTAIMAENLPIGATDLDGILRAVEDFGVNLTVIGPEAPLAMGLADLLRAHGHRVVGPSAAAARIESSKTFAKQVMARAGVTTAAYATFDDPAAALAHVETAPLPLVIKADGLAAGKGVVICTTRTEADAAVTALMVNDPEAAIGGSVIIEEFLQGPEVSLIALVDGERAVAFPLAQDHKRLGEHDTGPNTGGMGAYAPVPFVTDEERAQLVRGTIDPILRVLAEMGMPYRGFLFAGLILTPHGPRVLEYNCRLGDPEAQVLLPLVKGDLLPWLDMVANGRLVGELPLHEGAALGVVLAAKGYPDAPEKGARIEGECMAAEGVEVFHAGTVRDTDGTLRVSGGRVVTIVGVDSSIKEASARAYGSPLSFSGMQFRLDIGHGAGVRVPLPVAPRADPELPRIAVLASGTGSNLTALLEACAHGDVQARVALVVSHQADAGALQRAAEWDIPTFVFPVVDRRSTQERQRMEERLLLTLAQFRPHLVVLAGWMLILSPGFIARCPYPMLNVHPALLPDGPDDPLFVDDFPILRGAHAVRDALAHNLPHTGVTVHHVTADVDAGPVVRRAVVPIEPGDDARSLYTRIKAVEHQLLAEAVQTTVRSVTAGGINDPDLPRNYHCEPAHELWV